MERTGARRLVARCCRTCGVRREAVAARSAPTRARDTAACGSAPGRDGLSRGAAGPEACGEEPSRPGPLPHKRATRRPLERTWARRLVARCCRTCGVRREAVAARSAPTQARDTAACGARRLVARCCRTCGVRRGAVAARSAPTAQKKKPGLNETGFLG
ncbi:type II secretory ATPase GspE/PulE/Tfp pilus assembly ATPase PilB-like protein [Luteibacter sp. 3190]|nr:type II secretory ATPase GspE/PulE/Tfp pilus assembly ATPase PilB-like protein [Luteibacter sp. 3190]